MINLESRIQINKDGDEQIVNGYFLSIDDLKDLVRDFQAECYDGFVSNDISYIEYWLKNRDFTMK